jgi:hypothetical protein
MSGEGVTQRPLSPMVQSESRWHPGDVALPGALPLTAPRVVGQLVALARWFCGTRPGEQDTPVSTFAVCSPAELASVVDAPSTEPPSGAEPGVTSDPPHPRASPSTEAIHALRTGMPAARQPPRRPGLRPTPLISPTIVRRGVSA